MPSCPNLLLTRNSNLLQRLLLLCPKFSSVQSSTVLAIMVPIFTIRNTCPLGMCLTSWYGTTSPFQMYWMDVYAKTSIWIVASRKLPLSDVVLYPLSGSVSSRRLGGGTLVASQYGLMSDNLAQEFARHPSPYNL